MGAVSNIPSTLPIELFQQAIDCSANSLIICDAQQPNLPIVYVSPSFEALTGYTAAEVIGQNCRFLQGEDTDQIGLADIRQAIAFGTRCKVLLRNYHKSGRAFWNEVTISPLTNAQGNVTHYVGTQIDISHYLETFKALQESESRYRHLYEETPAMLHSIDQKGLIVSVSHYWLEKLGYQKEEVIGQPLLAFLTDKSKHKVAPVLLRSSAEKTCCQSVHRDISCRFVKKNGRHMDVLLSTIAECDGKICDGKTGAGSSMGVLVDVTERKQAQGKLRRSEALLRAINNLPPTGIFVMDCDTNEALFVNSEFYRIWQLEHLQSAVVRKSINGEQLLSECLGSVDLNAFVAASTARDFTNGNKVVEDEVPLLDGRTLRRIYGPIQENDVTFAYLYVFEDITARKEAVRRLAEATQAAEAANKAKSEFLANMSHELRSPLNAILGFTHILKESNPKKEQAEHLDIIYNSGEHLLALINDILDISKIEAGRAVLNEGEFNLHRLLDELKQMFYNAAAEKDLRLVIEKSDNLPQMIYSDRLKLRQVLINLISNAIKFTSQGTVTLNVQQADCSVHTSAGLTETIAFAVSDTGDGITEADQMRLFEAFVQTTSGLTAREGTGLGLAISYEYVQLLGGELTVDSTLGNGSTFSFSLAVAPVQASLVPVDAPIGRIAGLAPGQPTYRVLVVDDVSVNRKMLIHLLSQVGFEVKEASNGKEAIAQWKSWHPHLVWIDMRMPVMNGEEAARQIKALDPNQATRLIALTASAFSENKASALNSGCDDFVSKPVQAAEVFSKMSQHLGVRYCYETEPCQANISQSYTPALTPELIAQAPADWRYALEQATLDLDDEAILQLVTQLPPEQDALAQALTKCVNNLGYKRLIAAIQGIPQEADMVKS